MKTIAFYNVKGGVGKTTSTINVGYQLTKLGHRVLVIDLDAQSNASDFFDRCGNCEITVCELLSNGTLPPEKIATATQYKNLDIIPAYLTLGRAEKLLMSDTTIPQQFRLKRYLEKLKNRYDYCLLDCSPAAENLVNINGLACADAVFVPLKCDKWAMCGLENTIQVIEAVSSYNDRLKLGGAFFVQWENRKINKAVYEMLSSELGNKLLKEKIRKSKLAEESSYEREPISVLDASSTIAKDYIEFTNRMIELVG